MGLLVVEVVLMVVVVLDTLGFILLCCFDFHFWFSPERQLSLAKNRWRFSESSTTCDICTVARDIQTAS